MTEQRTMLRNLLALGFALLLLAGTVAAAAVSGESATEARPTPAESEAGPSNGPGNGPGGCTGCCARAAAEDSGPRCGGGAREGCCGAMARPGVGGAGYGRRGSGMGHGRAGMRHGGAGMGHGRAGMRHGGAGMGHGRAGIEHGGAGGMGHGGGPAVMQTARELMHDYRSVIERRIEEIDNGVITVTRSPSSPEAADAIRRHVREMRELLESGGRVRLWDPLFRELFERADEISMQIEELEDGMRVTETSDDPEVVKLIQAHARKVTEFVERGPAAAHEETPLPADYAAAE